MRLGASIVIGVGILGVSAAVLPALPQSGSPLLGAIRFKSDS